mgnify:CR=1 FL=1
MWIDFSGIQAKSMGVEINTIAPVAPLSTDDRGIFLNLNTDVDALLDTKQHPRTDEIKRVREILLATDEKIEECVKWSSPTFTYKGNIASFFMNSKKLVSLMFHKGATIPGNHALLEGYGKEARTARFYSLEDIEEKKEALEEVVRAWIRQQDSE